MSEEPQEDASIAEAGCIAVLCIGITVIAAMTFTTMFPDVEVPPICGFFSGGGIAAGLFVVMLLLHLRNTRAEAQDDDEGTD